MSAAGGPRLATTRPDLDDALRDRRPRGGPASGGSSIALVPTMGALHAGHRALVRRAQDRADCVVLSIFVNPLQFTSTSDLASYPRTIEADLAVATDLGVDVVWAPDLEQMYERWPPTVTVSSGRLGSVLEGAARPGHFDGVLTVVTKLLTQVRPDVAVFGEKDWQQLQLVRDLVTDLDLLPADRVVGVETVRDPDGLALSSRNARLTPGGRAVAGVLSAALRAGAAAAGSPAAVLGAASAVLDAEPEFVLDYLTLVDSDLAVVDEHHEGEARLLVAGTVEGVRLIDNAKVVCR